MSIDSVVENISGNLLDAGSAVVLETLQCASDIMRDKRADPKLRNLGFYPGDGQIYCHEGEENNWYITDANNNPLFKNLQIACTQLRQKGDYAVPKEDFHGAKQANSTVRVDLNKLKLTRVNDEFSYLTIDTYRKLTTFNTEEQKAILQFYGKTPEEFAANMVMLNEARIEKIQIDVLNPDYVMKQDGPVGRASCFSSFCRTNYFNAFCRYVDGIYVVRGIRRAVAEGNTQKIY